MSLNQQRGRGVTIKRVGDRQTDRQTDGRTDRSIALCSVQRGALNTYTSRLIVVRLELTHRPLYSLHFTVLL